MTARDIKRFEITCGEIRRRVKGPDKFSKTALSGYLRCVRKGDEALAKMHQYRAQPQKVARPKYSYLSKITEDEALELSRDIRQVNVEYLPYRGIAEAIQNYCFSNEPEGDHKNGCDKKLAQLEGAR